MLMRVCLQPAQLETDLGMGKQLQLLGACFVQDVINGDWEVNQGKLIHADVPILCICEAVAQVTPAEVVAP